MTTRQTPEERDVEQTLLGAAWRFRLLVIALTLIGAGLAYLYASASATTQYEATASLVVSDPRTSTLFSSDQTVQNATLYVEDQMAIMRSDSVMQLTSEIIEDELGITSDPIDLGEEMDISASTGNQILITYIADSEAESVTAVNGVIAAYGQVREQAASQDSASAISQLDNSIAAIDDEVASIEASIDEIQRTSVQGQLDEQYEAALSRLITLQARLRTATGEALDEVRASLADIDQQLNRLAQVATIEDASPRLVRLYEEQVRAIDRRANLAGQRDQLLVDTELLSGGISLASPAQFAEENTTAVGTIALLGGLLGLLIGGGIAYVLALRRRKFAGGAHPGWVLQTSMLAEIPVFGNERLRTELPVLDYPASATAEAFRFAATALEIPGRLTTGSEQSSVPHRTYLVTSPSPQEGKTIVAANVALAAARKGRRVLVIDADFGHQRLTDLLRGGPTTDPGITEVVEAGLDYRKAAISVNSPGDLDIMSRGNRDTNAPDFFSLPATHAFLSKVGELYDMVIIDGPPMLHIAYASILAHLADQVIVVTRHGGSVTRLEDLAQRLNLIGTPLAGYVYNGAPLRYDMTIVDGSMRDPLGEAALALSLIHI